MAAESKSQTMPYNTRRKSLSLPSLGIHLPVTHASRAAARLSPPSVAPTAEIPPSKKIKRSHGDASSMSPPPKRTSLKYDNTPPPSPDAEAHGLEGVKPQEIDWVGIKDEIVEAVLVQLQKTGNRPHLVKELAAILSQSLKIVEQSANPSAIISSRLSSYLKRTWTALAPCPVAKELETLHPRRTYFYLTTCPRQAMPDPLTIPFPSRAIISPSVSSAASRSDEADAERRRELSPSPEVDLSSPEYEDEDVTTPPTPTGSFSARATQTPRHHRATSPPLEKDEKEFTQTARGMQKRKLSAEIRMSGVPSEMTDHPTRSLDDSLFGEARNLNVLNSSVFASSPAMKPTMNHLSFSAMKRNFDECNAWADATVDWDLRSPENVELEELDGMFDDF